VLRLLLGRKGPACGHHKHVTQITLLIPRETTVEVPMQYVDEPTLDELLLEPIVRQVMARDGVSERQVRETAGTALRQIEKQWVPLTARHLPTLLNSYVANVREPGVRVQTALQALCLQY
jgi:hypothetical protein